LKLGGVVILRIHGGGSPWWGSAYATEARNMIRLKKSTASQEVPLGPFVDATDGFTLEDGLGPIAASDIKIWKNGMAAGSIANVSGGTAAFGVDGTYVVTLDATDTNTVGPLVIIASPAGARPVRVECEVLEGVILDSLFGAVGLLADVKALNGSASSLNRLSSLADTIVIGITHSSTPCTTTSITVLDAVGLDPMPTQVDQYKDKILVMTSFATNTSGDKCVGRRITASTTGSPPVLTIDPLPVAPGTLNAFVIMDANVVRLTSDGYVQSDIASILNSIQAATAFKRMALSSSYGTLAAGSTQTVLQISGSMTPALSGADQVKGRVCLIVDESGSQAGLKLQGGKINTSTTTSITLETPLTTAPSSGNVIIIL